MNKKFISLFVALMLLASTVYVPAFAADSESLIAEDVITYPDTTVVLYENDFESGDIGTIPNGFSYKSLTELGGESGLTSSPNYLSAKYSEGIGTNETQAMRLYDKGYSNSATDRYTDDGQVDTSAVYDNVRNYDTIKTEPIIVGAKHVITTFKYYNAGGAKSGSNILDCLYVQHSKSSGVKSTTTPTVKIYADYAELNFRDGADMTSGVKQITGIPKNTWLDVVFETTYGDVNQGAVSKLTINGKTVQSYITTRSTSIYSPNGYDEPGAVSFYLERARGGIFYIDDLKIVKKENPSENFKAAVDSFTFDAAVSGETSNMQTAVYESWPGGLMTSYPWNNVNYNVEWTTSNPNIISETGVVTRRSYAQNVTLTAKISESDKMYAERTFNVIVAPLENAPLETILNEYAENSIKASLFSTEVTAGSNVITKDILPLPTRDEVADVDIAWTASPSGYIDVATGEVTRPSYTAEDVLVTLTATLSRGGEGAVTKSIQYTVAKRTNPNVTIQDAIDNMVITEEPYEKITDDLNLPTEYGDIQITWDTTHHSQIADNGKVTRGNEEVTGTITANFSLDGVTASKTYTLTVYPSVQKMLEIDVNAIDKTGWDALVADFTVPLVGEKYGAVLSWTSSSSYVQIGDNGYVKVKRPPNSHSSDLAVVLTVNAKIGRDETTIDIPVTVLRQADDATSAQDAADTIDFDLIRGSNTQDAVVSDLSLVKGFIFDTSLEVEWTSSNENVVKTTGEVVRPLPGMGDADVTLTAKVCKNYSYSNPVIISFTVKALSSIDELLQDAKDDLTFAKLSSEEIDNVTENLSLPATGKYGTTIEWTSSSKHLSVSGNQGIVTRPEWGEAGGVALLNATISYNDGSNVRTVHKSFNITIPENSVYEENKLVYSEDFNSWRDNYKFAATTDKGSWVAPTATTGGSKADICENPNGSQNNAIYLTTESGSLPAYLTYTSHEGTTGNKVSVGMKFYVKDDFAGVATVDVFSIGSNFSVATAYINGTDNTIDIVTGNNTTNPTTLKLRDGIFEKNIWNDLRFDVNTVTKKFYVYLNGANIIENGSVSVKETGDAFVTLNGIPYTNADSVSVKGIRWLTTSGTIYLDDVYINTSSVYTEDQKMASDIWEAEFLSNVNINYVNKDFKFPDITFEGVTVTIESGQSEILNISGGINVRYYTPVDEVTPITMTVSFNNGKSVYKKVYVLYVYPPEVYHESISDTDAVAADLNTIVNEIKNYTLNNLKINIDFANIQVKNGSKITYSSSNKSAISDEGKITMTDELQYATITITAEKGIAKKTETVNVIVGKRSQVHTGNSGGPVSSGGPGGPSASKPPVSGENSTPQTGIDINKPEDGTGNQTASNFTDVAKDHWAYDQINYMVENKIMNGVGDGRIEPERTINREEFVKMLVVTLGLDLKEAAADFTDVDKNEWYAPYVATIKEKGLINGFEDGSFGIGQNISRQDLAVLIYRSANLATEEKTDVFADDAEIADYAEDAVYTLRKLGIINGKENGNFDPNASATRAETATMLYKAIKKGLFD